LTSTLAGTNIATTTSMSAFVGNASESEMYNASIVSAENKSAEVIGGQEENELLVVVRDSIAENVTDIKGYLASILDEVKAIRNLETLESIF
jgi:fructose-specific component phosphotransferase system IIB-like protein